MFYYNDRFPTNLMCKGFQKNIGDKKCVLFCTYIFYVQIDDRFFHSKKII